LANQDLGPSQLPTWQQYADIVSKVDEALASWKIPMDAQTLQEAYRLLFLTLGAGYLSAFSDPDAPDFVPLVNNIYNSVGTNPDFVYAYSRIDGTGTYRLTGKRGDGLFLLFDFNAGGLGVMDDMGPSVGVLDTDTLTIGADGSFDVLLSETKPAGHKGDWRPLDPRTKTVNIRQAAYDWGSAQEARIAIERVDRPTGAHRLTAEELAVRLKKLADYPRRYATFALSYYQGQLDRGLVNKLEHDDWAGRGGLAGQHYYQGIFSIKPGEALLLETELPKRMRYWNIQLNDRMWNSIDWFNHQSSLNGGQAVLDADGKFRAVISLEDPGVPNWLDPAGRNEGSLMLRWTEADTGPEPKVRIVPLAELRSHLPASTGTVTPEARDSALRARRRGAQFRRRW
jgi:hypothetical protein